MAERSASRTERAHRYLMDELLRGRWQAGDTLSTYALAEEIGISRTPVLEALKRLEADGLVQIIPQVGCRVVGPTSSALRELFAVRAALEGLAAAGAARQIDDGTLAELEGTLHQLDGAARRGDRATFAELDQRFHLQVIDASRMPRLIGAARGVWLPLRYQLARLPITDEQLRETIPEHGELYESIERRAPWRARAAAERHVRLSAARFVAPLDRTGADRLVHSALIYARAEDFLASTVPFVQEGLNREERLLVVTTTENAELLAGALGADAAEVEFRDSAEWYQLPSHTLLSYQRYVEYADRGRVRIIGEVAWNGDDRSAMSEWARYESLVNVAFALEPVTFLCPYDDRTLPSRIVADARRTHPELCHAGEASPSAEFTDPVVLSRELDHEPFRDPTAPVSEQPITPDLRGVRGFILDQAHKAGVSGKPLQDAFLAVQEVAADVGTHSPGSATLRAWVQNGALVYEVRDESAGTGDHLAAQLAGDPALMSAPRGLWMARLLCDVVEARATGGALVVRLHVSLR